jgi:hypothetical protein
MGAGWGPKTIGQADNTGQAQIPLIPGSYDDIVLTRSPLTQDIIDVKAYRQSTLILHLILTYDINDNLIEVKEVP